MTIGAIGLPSLDDIEAARRRIAEYILPTPLTVQHGIGYKLEFLQQTGSFKPRGAFNAALQFTPEQRAAGVVAVSGGNHGLGVAYVCGMLGIPATIVMPKSTPEFVVERARRDGAVVELAETIAAAFERTDELTRAGRTLLHPFDDERVIAGQGTIGLEMLEQMPDADTIVVSIGGGGVLAGIAIVAKTLKPQMKIVGVETRGADAMRQALDAGHPVQLPAITSIARTLGSPSVTERTLRAMERYVDDCVVVDDRDAVATIVELQETLGIVVEPASSCTYAALKLGMVPGKKPLLLMCGRNVRLDEIQAWRRRFLT